MHGKPNFRQKTTASLIRLYPFYSGCSSLANSRVTKRISGSQPEKIWSKVPGGEVLADLGDYVGRAAYFAGDLDKKITWICKKIVRDGDTVLDIGANIGIVTVLLSDLVGSNGTVHCFEPNPELVGQLNKTIDRNKKTNITLHPIGLGSSKSTLELVIPNKNKGEASFLRSKDDRNITSVQVEVDTLDEVFKLSSPTHVRLVKIDVECYETTVFQGGHEFLSEIRPEAILFELNYRRESRLYDEPLIKLLDSYDYDFLAIPKNLFRMKLIRLDSIKDHSKIGHDFLAVHKGSKHREILRLVRASP